MIRRTKLRTAATHARYVRATTDPDFFRNAPSIKKFKYWRIIENTFPYDAIADIHHMLIPIRCVTSEQHLTVAELHELMQLKTRLDYDSITLNFPHAQSAPHWLHFHLLRLRLA